MNGREKGEQLSGVYCKDQTYKICHLPSELIIFFFYSPSPLFHSVALELRRPLSTALWRKVSHPLRK